VLRNVAYQIFLIIKYHCKLKTRISETSNMVVNPSVYSKSSQLVLISE